MKAAVVEEVGKLAVRELAEPEMGDYQARCRMLYGAVCAGTDSHLINFHAPFCYWMKMPYILGHESIGTVTAVGAKVRNLKPGDMVTRVGCPDVGGVSSGWGGFAEVGIATDWRAMQEDGVNGWQDSTVNQILPPDIDPAVGTLFITWRETLSYSRRMGITPGVSVLVIGSGGNGLSFVSHACNLGAAKVVLVGAANRAAEGRLAGAAACLDYRQENCWQQVKAEVADGYDFVIDAVGKADMVAKGQDCLKAGGTIGVYGLDECGKISLAPDKTFTFYGGGYDEAETHEPVLNFYRAGQLNPSVWLDRGRIFPLADIGQAFAALRDRTLVKPLIKLQP